MQTYEDIQELDLNEEDTMDALMENLDGNDLTQVLHNLYWQYEGDAQFQQRLKDAICEIWDLEKEEPDEESVAH